MADKFDQEDPFKKYGGNQIDQEDPFKKYGGVSIEEPSKKKVGSGIGGKVGSSVGRLDVGAGITEIDDEGKPIGKALGKVSGITTPEQAKISRVNKAFGKIESFAGGREDFEEIYKQAPQKFENLAKQVAPNVNKGEIDKFYTTEAARKDALVDRVFQSYNQQKTKAQLEAARNYRPKIDEAFSLTTPLLSKYTGKQYQLPQSEAQVSEILSDLNNEKEKLKTELTTNWNLSEVQAKAKELSDIESAIKQNLTYQVGRMALERLSQNNPNVTSKDIGKEIFRVLHPDEYDLYEKIGGDKPVSFTVGTQRDTPVEADALNEQMVQVGNEIKRMYGNETAIQDADIEEQTAKRKYTFQRQAQVKQKIAAILHERGLSPDKATEELKDKVVNKYLPDEDKEIWYNNNKIYNDVDLPSTGFAYSLKNAYYDTVKDAVGTVFGGLMPNRKKMRAAELLEGMSTSYVLGEDPQFKARLSQLKEKEKTQQLNDQEKQEKEQLEQFTDLRSKKQKIFDMAGSGVGQILGLGSISAFTGGLSSARTGFGALKSLVAPSGGRGGIMAASYLMSHENNAKEALRMFPNEKDALKRFFSTEFNTAIDMAVEQIFPEEQFLSGIAKKEVSKLITNLTAKNIASTLNDNAFKQLAKNIVGRSKKLLATPLQETAEEEIALSLKKTFEGIIAPDKSEGLTLKDVVETGEQAFWGSVLLGAPKGVLGYTNNKVPLTALWDAASSQEGYTKTKMTIERLKRDGELTEAEAKDRLDNLELGRNEYLNNPILSGDMGGLDAGQKQNYFARILNEAILKKQADAVTDPNLKKQYEQQIKESEAIREKIYKGEIKVTPENEELTKKEFEKQEAEKTIIDQDRVLGDEETVVSQSDEELLTTLQELAQEGVKDQDLQFFVDQAANAPNQFIETYGEQVTQELLDKATTEQIQKGLEDARKFENNPNVSLLEKELERRGKTIADFVAPKEASTGLSSGDVRKGDKQFKKAFGELNEAKTPQEKLNAINKIRKNEKAGGVLTDAEKKKIDEVEKELKEEGYEMPNLYGIKFNEGMRLEVINAKPDDTLGYGEEVITRVVSPQINKDGKMIQAAKVEVTVGTKEGGLSRNEWLVEQKNKSLSSNTPSKEQPKAETPTQEASTGLSRGDENKTGLVLYHGSPHSFENFDISKLGSGEGAQAFGHGLYFTNKVDIAKGYANKLGSKKNFWEALQNGQTLSLSKSDFDFISKELDALGYDGSRAENENLGTILVDGKEEHSPESLEAMAVLFGKNAKSELEGYGLSEPEINRLLDIKKKISDPQLYKVAVHEGKSPSEYDYIDWGEKLTDSQRKKIGNYIPENATGEEAYKALSKKLGSDQKASEFLLSKGIDGITYKSEKGTGGKTGEGRNYVIFDPKSIRVDEINEQKQAPKDQSLSPNIEPKSTTPVSEPTTPPTTQAKELADKVSYDIGDKLRSSGFIQSDKGGIEKNGVRIVISKDSALGVDRSGDVFVSDSIPENIVLKEINVVNEEARGKGNATQVLRELLKAADDLGKTIFIEPTPIKKYKNVANLTQKQLINWYERHGFKKINDQIWKREPGAKITETEGIADAENRLTYEEADRYREAIKNKEITKEEAIKSIEEMGFIVPKDISESTETQQQPPPPQTPKQEPKEVGIKHKETEAIRQRYGLPEYERVGGKTNAELEAEADRLISEGYDIEKLIKKIEGGTPPTGVENYILTKYIGNLEAKFAKDKSDETLKELKRLLDATDRIGSLQSEAFRTRKAMSPADDSLASFFIKEMDSLGVDELTQEQKDTITKEYEEIKATNDALQKKIVELERQMAEMEAKQKVSNEARRMVRGRKTKQQFNEERKKIIGNIREKLRKAKGETQATAVPYLKELIVIAPDVAKLVKNLVEEGVTNLADIVDNIHEYLKEEIDGIQKKDVVDLIAGVYDEKKPTRNELAKKLFDLKAEAKLLNRYAELVEGKEPASEKKKIQRNKELSDLRKKIKESDVTKLSQVKEKYKTQIAELEQKIKDGDFSKPEPKKKIKLDKEGQQLRDKLIKLKQQRDARILLNQRINETKKQRGLRLFAEVLNIPRTLMTIGDFSGLLRQGIFGISHPSMMANASKQMFKTAFSQKEYDRWFADLKDDPRYYAMKESKLSIADSLSHDLSEREEVFMSTLAEKIPIVGQTLTIKGKKVIPGLNIVKGSERSYTALLNKMRVDLFNYFADSMEARGLTIENAPKQYKAMAEYINNATGRSDFGKHLNRIAPILNSVFFSPRLIASRVNMLTYFMQPRFWKTLPREARIDYFRSWASLLSIGLTILALAQAGGADVEDDPRSSDFGKIRSGDTRWDIWGGAQPYMRVFAQVVSGKRKSTNSGEIYELTGDDAFGETRAGVVSDFFRGKLAPVPASMVDVLSGRTTTGDKIVYEFETDGVKEVAIDNYIMERLLPMTITGTREAIKEKGASAILTVGVPSVFGVGTQTYGKPIKEVRDEVEYEGVKIKLTKEQYLEYRDLANKYINQNVEKLKSLKEYQQIEDRDERLGIERSVKNYSVKKAEQEIIDKYEATFKDTEELKDKAKEKKEKREDILEQIKD